MAESKISTYKDLLWTNPNPKSNFSAQDITINWQQYKMLEIYYENDLTGDIVILDSVKFIPINGKAGYVFAANGPTGYRAFTMYSTYIHFTEGYYYATYGGGNPTVANGKVVPYQIYGIR